MTGAALGAYAAVILLNIFVPSFQSYSVLALVIVWGIWAALCLMISLTGTRRRTRIIVAISLVLTVTLSLSTHWFGFAGLRLFRKHPNPRALVLPLTMTAMGACGVLLSAWVAKPVPPIPAHPMSTSDELKYIFDTDQSDRATMYMVIGPERDHIRLGRVKALYRAGLITQPMDRYHAAFVYQHGSCADDFKVAYELAGGPGMPEQHPPLAHLAYDRWQLSLGKQQTYGTQLFPVPIKRPCPPR